MELNETLGYEPGALANSSVFYAVIPAICLPIACVDFSINIVLVRKNTELVFRFKFCQFVMDDPFRI